ncbi:MAG: pilus assembly protein PilM [Planctomycetota bacterium]
MAKKPQHVWGVEIGQSALKALRCHLEGDAVVADMFDFVEYPKILTQPEAEPEKLIADALEQFTSRNDLKGNIKIGVSVPGQSGLAKFFKPPPVEVKKIADIVKYEARQQIPFDLNDVIWDFQQMEGSQIEDGYALESEVGLFAMKKEAVFRALKPYRDRGMDVDLVQLAPISIYNMVAYEQFANRLAEETFDPERPPKNTVILSIGTDASDLVVTNGFRIWQRSIPIGGNHFTRQLTKDLKLTFAKAEHLKRNAMQADDPKLIFQSMRPVFNDMVTEVQRSLSFFKQLNKKSDVENMLVMGNTAKMPGLLQFLSKNLSMDVTLFDRFAKLGGQEVSGALPFKENAPAFGVVYGLCLQLLNRGPMRTNLLPREILLDRIIRNKKPWAVGALSLLLVGFVSHHAMLGQVYRPIRPEICSEEEKSVSNAEQQSQGEIKKDSDIQTQLKLYKDVGIEVSKGAERRMMCLELYKAIEASLNRDESLIDKSPEELPYSNRKDFHITRVEQVYLDNIAEWYTEDFKKLYEESISDRKQLGCELVDRPAETNPDPTGPGWVIEIQGYHFYNGDDKKGLDGAAHVEKYFINFLENGEVQLPGPNPDELKKVPLFDLGIRRPILRNKNAKPDKTFRMPNPDYFRLLEEKGLVTPGSSGAGGVGMAGGPKFGGRGGGSMGAGLGASGFGMGSGGEEDPGGGGFQLGSRGQPALGEPLKDSSGKVVVPDFPAPRYDFIVQFAWKPGELSSITGPAVASPSGQGGEPALGSSGFPDSEQ